MTENMTQDQRLDYLVEEFKVDSGEYKDLQTPGDRQGKRRILRSLMNIRMPKKLDDFVLTVQDEYLQERIRKNGIVALSDIPEIRDGLSIWQGDITRLAVDAIVNAANSQMRFDRNEKPPFDTHIPKTQQIIFLHQAIRTYGAPMKSYLPKKSAIVS
jgi:hypothetical protein